MTEALEIAVRAYSVWEEEPWRFQPHEALEAELARPRLVLVLDTETTTDPSQRLLFGSYRLCDVFWDAEGPKLSCVEEGLLYGDTLPESDSNGFDVLVDYARTHAPAIDTWGATPSPILQPRPRSVFLKEVFRPAVLQARAVLVCFNLPFDLSRLALHWSKVGPRRRQTLEELDRRSAFEGGFSLCLDGRVDAAGKWHDNPAWPRALVKHIDSKRALKAFGPAAKGFVNPEDLVPDGDGRKRTFRGHLLDLRTIAFVLTDKGHTLESACDAFDVPYKKRNVTHGVIRPEYVDYNREDVEATCELYVATMREYIRHPIDLQATKAYSPATLGKAYLEALGITPPVARLGRIR